MHIKSLKLTNWRNFLDKKIDFNSKSTIVLIGKNGLGKTNILESIYLLSTTKSFRTKNNYQLINWQKDFCRIEADIITKDEPKLKIEIVINRNPQRTFQKIAKINKVPKKMIDILGKFKAVLFSPEAIEIIQGSPRDRRKYLDSVLAVTDHKYAQALLEFTKILRRRNKLLNLILEGRGKENELDFWDSELVKSGSYIILRRIDLIKFYNSLLTEKYREISGGLKDQFRLKYLDSLVKEDEEVSARKIKENYLKNLQFKRAREIEFGTTLSGPQRDEIVFVLNDRAINSFGSRGELRSAILATKMVEIEYLKENSENEKPILLLDDVFSELDSQRRKKLAQTIKGTQAIITTTDLSHLETELRKEAKIIKLV